MSREIARNGRNGRYGAIAAQSRSYARRKACMTAVGYGQEGDEAAADFAYRWPSQTHIVGKDLIRFH